MAATNELRKALSQRLLPLVGDVEAVVHRYGYLRVFGSSLSVLGTLGIFDAVLGLGWLRIVFASSVAVVLVLLAAISAAGAANLRNRVAHNEALLHEYAEALQSRSPTSVRAWRQEIVVETNGDANVLREITLDAAEDDVPRYLYVNLVYYGRTELTPSDKRRVAFRVWRAAPGAESERIRAHATSNWTTSRNGCPRLDVYVHLGRSVLPGEIITVQWKWPAYSADLMRGIAPEAFDVLFDKKVTRFDNRVVFRDTERTGNFRVRNEGAENFVRERQGADTVVRFSGDSPQFGHRIGFVADLSDQQP